MRKFANFIVLSLSLSLGIFGYNFLHKPVPTSSNSVTEITSDITQDVKEKYVTFDILISRQDEIYEPGVLERVQRAITKFDEDRCLIFVSGYSTITPDPSGHGQRRLLGFNFKCESLGENGHIYHHGNRIYNLLNLNAAVRAEIEKK